MSGTTDLMHAPDHAGSWTRGRFLRAALGGGAVVSGGIALALQLPGRGPVPSILGVQADLWEGRTALWPKNR